MLRSMSDHYRSSPSTTKTTSAVSSESGGSPLRMRPTHDADSWDRRFSMEVRILLLPARPTYRRLLYKSPMAAAVWRPPRDVSWLEVETDGRERLALRKIYASVTASRKTARTGETKH